MRNRNCRRRYRNSNELGDITRINCDRVLGGNYDCNRRNSTMGAALEDAYNAGYRDGCCNAENVREQALCEAYEQGVRDGCQCTKQEALDCIERIRCC